MRFKTFLTERINPVEMEAADKILTKLKKLGLVRLPSKKIGEVTKRDGSGEKNIMIRVKPTDEKKEFNKKEVMSKIEKILKADKNAKSIKGHEKSPNSAKYPSVSFKIDKREYDIVIANGSNAGENYEKDFHQELEDYHEKGIPNMWVEEMELQMEELDPTFKTEDVVGSPKRREGSTRRSNVPGDEVGAIIGDIVFNMKDGSKRYVSVKNKKGGVFANLGGVGPTFSKDFKMDPTTEIGKLLVGLGYEPDKVQKGFEAYVSGIYVLGP